ncbi:MAG TPA: hypothetical protein VLF68_04105 [Candidatus Saccharimonadales bacterium]|nr:hypothetical protein [Candidatus Saccharimonadales bacterium]
MKLSKKQITAFQKEIYAWFRIHKRDLPWRPPSLKLRKDKTLNPYRILVSEMMLQQTQVGRVLPKYELWLKTFPTIESLAAAKSSDVLRVWSGLGYNRRALYLQKAAQNIIEKHKGKFPKEVSNLKNLPGVGENTAGAVAAFSFNSPAIFIETNIRRVFIHTFFKNSDKVSDKEILQLIKQTIDIKNPRDWYYALMDFGNYLSRVIENPNRKSRHYARQSTFKNSDRYFRGQIVRLLLKAKTYKVSDLEKHFNLDKTRLEKIIEGLEKDTFIKKIKDKVALA